MAGRVTTDDTSKGVDRLTFLSLEQSNAPSSRRKTRSERGEAALVTLPSRAKGRGGDLVEEGRGWRMKTGAHRRHAGRGTAPISLSPFRKKRRGYRLPDGALIVKICGFV